MDPISQSTFNTLSAFAAFANEVRDDNTVAKFNTRPLGGLSWNVKDVGKTIACDIITSTTDKPYAFTRSDADKNANNTTRNIFLNAVADIFGGKQKIPPEVIKEMKFADYDDKGHPLTARRIRDTVDAVIKFLTKDNASVKVGDHTIAGSDELRKCLNTKGSIGIGEGMAAMQRDLVNPGQYKYGGKNLLDPKTAGTGEDLKFGFTSDYFKKPLSDELVPFYTNNTDFGRKYVQEGVCKCLYGYCGATHADQEDAVMMMLSGKGLEPLKRKMKEIGVECGETPAVNFELRQNDGDVVIKYSNPKGLPFEFSWTATVNRKAEVATTELKFNITDVSFKEQVEKARV